MSTKFYIHAAEHPDWHDVSYQVDYADEIEFGIVDGEYEASARIRWYRLGGRVVPQLEAFGEEWSMLTPDLIQAIQQAAKSDPNPNPEKICQVLENIGFVNQTG